MNEDFEMSLGEMPTMGGEDSKVLAIIDRYELMDKLGRGAFGAVFLARDTVADTLVALKTLPPELNHSPEDLEAVRDNFKLVSKLAHPHIAQLKHLHHVDKVQDFEGGIHISKGEYLVVMEYVEGSTLRNWLKQFPQRKAPYEKVLAICHQVAAALDYAHSKNIIHRDIKPGNIMVSGEGEVKVLDFGLAAEVRSSMSRLSTDKGSSSGTRPYMPLEQLLGKKQNHTADQYALAVMLYEMLSGEVPFQSVFETNDTLLIRDVVTQQNIEPLEELDKKKNLLVSRALAKTKEERFASCQEFISALESGKATRVAKPVKTSKTQSKSKVPVIFVLVIILGIGGYFAYNTHKKAETEKLRLEEVARQKAEQERLVAEKAEQERQRLAKESAEKQAKIKALYNQAQRDFEMGNYDQVSKVLSELLSLDNANAKALELKKQNTEKMGLESVSKPRAQAQILSEEIKTIDSSNGFDKPLKELKVILLEASFKLENKKYGSAVDLYNQYFKEGKQLQFDDVKRKAYLQYVLDYENEKELIDMETYQKGYYREALQFFQEEQIILKKARIYNFEKAQEELKELGKKFIGVRRKIDHYKSYQKHFDNLERKIKSCALEVSQVYKDEWDIVQEKLGVIKNLTQANNYFEALINIESVDTILDKVLKNHQLLVIDRNAYQKEKEAFTLKESEEYYLKYVEILWRNLDSKRQLAEKKAKSHNYNEAKVIWKELNTGLSKLESKARFSELESKLSLAHAELDQWKLAHQLLTLNPKHAQAAKVVQSLQPIVEFPVHTDPDSYRGQKLFLDGKQQKVVSIKKADYQDEVYTLTYLLNVEYGKTHEIRVQEPYHKDRTLKYKVDHFKKKSAYGFGPTFDYRLERWED